MIDLEAKLNTVRDQRASIIEEKQKAFQCLDLHSIDGLLAMRIANLINEYYAAKIATYEPQITILAELIKEQQHNDCNNRYYISFDRSDSALLSPPTANVEALAQLRP